MSKSNRLMVLATLLSIAFNPVVKADVVVFPLGSEWKYFKGTAEASSPVDAWRQIVFNDTSWLTGNTPMFYENSSGYTGNTLLSDMFGGYSSVFMRKTFQITDPAEVGFITLELQSDDGCIVWVNGVEVASLGRPPDPLTFDSEAINSTGEPKMDSPIISDTSFLVAGANVIAVQAVNASLGGSSDFFIDLSLTSSETDFDPPVISNINPAPGTFNDLTQLTITFSEPVAGVDANDLVINNNYNATSVVGGGDTYTFFFTHPPFGTAQFSFLSGHGITDTAIPPNPFDDTAPEATWQYDLVDIFPPLVASTTPVAGTTVRSLTEISVRFQEEVTGVDASDLLINGTPASGLSVFSAFEYVFSFPEPPVGPVSVAWISDPGIVDLSPNANVFAGGGWDYTLDPTAEAGSVVISEFLSSNGPAFPGDAPSLQDENGEYVDWIEIFNAGETTVNLELWSLTDSPGNLNKWRFPNTNILAGDFMVIFASGKNRRIPGEPLHTSFGLNTTGEYLALVKPDGSIATEFSPSFPSQLRNVTYGFGFDATGTTISTEARYFVTPTPGDPNGAGTEDIGPIIREVAHSPQVPEDNENLLVTARVLPALNLVNSFTLHYRIMFGTIQSLPMFDDGAHGDGAAGDGLYGNTIPAAGLSSPGDMIRYYLTSTDLAGNSSRWPIYEDQSVGGSEEYLGTMVNDPALTSKLPIFEWFVESSQLSAIDSENGGRAAVFHDGELYDNVYVELRGNTTAGYLKKSHRLEFPREHRLRHAGSDYRVRNTSFTADYGDPSYMRQGLSFWLANEIGAPGPFYYPVRLQMNGEFYQLANHNNVIRGEILESLGYDDRGALYQAAGQINTAQSSTGGFRKRTRLNENNADYQAMASGIAESVPLATREVNAFDMLDVAEMINYMVTARWAHENDDVWANMTVYRDTEGDQLWRIIPFDMNLSWGAIYYEGGVSSVIEGVQATNDIHKAFPMYGSSQTPALNSGSFNRLYDVIFDVPRTREMFLRRMRTMMDEYVKPPGTHPLLLPFEKRILALQELMREEANRDRAKWGWPGKGGQTNFDPGIGFDDGVDQMIRLFVVDRRNHFYIKHSVNNTDLPIGTNKDNNAGIPNSQPSDVVVEIVDYEVNPSSGNQDEEFICLTNRNNYAVDISGWKLDGAVDYTFRPGTVIPSNDALYVTPNINTFRTRTSGPRGGLGLFAVGNYNGQLSARGESIELFDQNGRGVHTNSFPGNPSLAQQYLRVTEIMYNPAPNPMGMADPQNFEYIELKNIGPAPLNLAGIKFTVGITFTFGSEILPAGETIILVRDPIAFVNRYGSGLNTGGVYVGFLDSSGERLVLKDAQNEEILDFSYNNAWYPITDGVGFSLVVVDENAEPDLWNSKSNWRPSGQPNGTPGAPDPGAPLFAPILVNEILTHTDFPILDAVELYNTNATDVNIRGWYLSDDFLAPTKYRIPNDTMVPALGYVVLDEDDFNPDGEGPEGFTFSSLGDEVYLFSGDPAGTDLTGYFHGYEFGPAANGVTFGPHFTSTGSEKFVAMETSTLGGPNSGPKVGPVVISEIMYHPPDVDGTDNVLDEFIELQNISGASVDLYDTDNPANTWQLTDAVTYAFPTGISLPAGGYLLVVSFDPANTGLQSAFRSKYGVPAGVPVYGPYDGKLDNSDEEVELFLPDSPEPGIVPYILADKVNYKDEFPWPSAADGVGPSLQKTNPADFGNDPQAWFAASPNAGTAGLVGSEPVITVQPADETAIGLSQFTLGVNATGSGPLNYQWKYNGNNIVGATTSLLTLQNVLPEQAGLYTVVVYNQNGSVVSRDAQVTVILPALIVGQPQPLSVELDASASFSVDVFSDSELAYQWRKNGTAIPGATASVLTINNVTREDDALYDVVVTDAVSSVTSDAARLTVLIRPSALIAPVTQTVPVGGTATFSIVSDGTIPMGYRWRQGSQTIRTDYLDSNEGFLTIANAQLTDAGPYSVILTNEAFVSPGILVRFFSLVVEADTDGDGLSDDHENANGLDPNNPDDALVDRDGDGMTEVEEHIAGTDPADPNSYLKIEEVTLGTGVNVSFNALAGRSYMIVYKDKLSDSTWNKLYEKAAPAADGVLTVSDPKGSKERYYRLATPRTE